MRNRTITALFLAPLLGCFAQLENPDIALTHNLCGGTTNCMPGAMPLGLIQISGQNTFTVNFGNQPLLKPSSSLGPATMNTSLILNAAMIQLQNSASGNFNNIDGITLYAAPSATTDCTATGSGCTVLADFSKARDGTANQTITLTGKNVDLINYISTTSHTLALQFTASGSSGPANPWNADVSMDMAMKARAKFP
jgi:hypothetical protein